MKRCLALLLAVSLFANPAFASYDDGRTEAGVLGRLGIVEGRGFANIIGMPFEIPRTIVEEKRNHGMFAVVTTPPKMLFNIFTRVTSAVYDVAITPWILPFTDDISPITEGMGLPPYPWQMSEDDY